MVVKQGKNWTVKTENGKVHSIHRMKATAEKFDAERIKLLKRKARTKK